MALTAQRTADFMVELFEVPDPGESRGRQVTAKEILDEGVARIEGSLKDEPAVQGDLMYTMGRTYTGLGLYPDAARILGVARQKRVAAGADPIDQYATENALARALFEKGDLDAAKALYQKLVDEAERDIARGDWRVDYAVALTGMGETTLYRDTPEAAQKYYERARDLLAAHGMSETEEMAEALRGLAGALIELRRFSDAERILEQSKMYYINHNKHSYKMTTSMNDLAHVLYMQRKLPQAKEIALLALRSEIELLGDVHPETLITENNIARYEFELGDIRAAAERLSRVIEGQENLGLGDVVDFAFYLNTMGEIQNELGEYQAATAFLQKAAVLIRGNKHRLFGPIETNLGRAFCASGDTQVGLAHVVAGRVGLKDHYPHEDWRYGAADEFESRCRAKLGETEKARALAKSAYERLQEQLGQDHFFTKRAKTWMESLTG
ncbi:MAG: tetratricopeptide repeat protein [Parvularculaceae bacterium]